MDFTNHTDEELDDLRIEVLTEIERRSTIAGAPAQAEQLNAAYIAAVGRRDGQEWVQPTGAHDAYPLGAIVTHEGDTWRSLIPANVWSPTAYPAGWEQTDEEVDPPPAEEPGAAAWTEGVAYKVGDLATYAGTTYRCLQAHTAIAGWTPAAVPALWTPA